MCEAGSDYLCGLERTVRLHAWHLESRSRGRATDAFGACRCFSDVIVLENLNYSQDSGARGTRLSWPDILLTPLLLRRLMVNQRA